jgi:hypothetical protein
MPLAAAFASILLSAQPAVPPDQAALSQCLAGFVTQQQQAGTPVADFTNALSNACHREERAYRTDYVARAAARGTTFVPADGEAFQNVLNLRIGYREAYLVAQTTCNRSRRR